MTACLPFSKIHFLTVNPRTGYILFGFIMPIIIYCYYDFCYLNDIDPVPMVHYMVSHLSASIILSFLILDALSNMLNPMIINTATTIIRYIG